MASTRRVLYIHAEQKVKYGAHYINDLIVEKLRMTGMIVDTIYPKQSIDIVAKSLLGIKNILFFFSLYQKRGKARRYDLIQGTTYTTLPFIGGKTPVISHFGSTNFGFLKSVPSVRRLQEEKEALVDVFRELSAELNLTPFDISIKALRDINHIELHVAKGSDHIIATSERVKRELVRNGVNRSKITVVHNAIEDYWFSTKRKGKARPVAQLVYIGRMGDDLFTIRLKGITRLIYVLREFADLEKHVIGMCRKTEEYGRIFSRIPNTKTHLSVEKKRIPKLLNEHYGDLYINTGRYEGFCLSLIEAMSQGLVPITFPIGVAEEIIVDGRNGYIVHSVDEMREKISYLKSRSKLRAKMAREAIQTARQFSPDRMVGDLVAVYDRVSPTA